MLRNFKTKATLLLTLLTLTQMLYAQSKYDQDKPFGFCTCSSRTSSTTTFDVTGGGTLTYPVPSTITKTITLTSTGKDMASAISSAVKNYDVIVFDGSKGDFLISKTISFSGISNKTLLGINGARLCTTWFATPEIIQALNDAGVPRMSTSSNTGGTLSTGTYVSEQAEFNTRQIIINITGDTKESYRSSGIFSFSGCSNLVIRNLKFVGPGSIDVSGSDLISFTSGTKHCWVDHCDFTDGMDGNFDITQKSDFNTVSWCTFSYTERAYMHQNTNLVGSSDSEATGYLNTTYACNVWGKGCRARMPMARVGKIHMLNNFYDCAGNGTACINPRKNSEFLIEGNYFNKGVTNIFSQTDAVAWTWKNTNYAVSASTSITSGGATVTVPYTYTVIPVQEVATEVALYAGATLFCDNIITDIVEATVPATQGTFLTFQDNARYSMLAINSRLNSFYANKSKSGFGKFDDNGVKIETEFAASTTLDYVPGLVAKAVIEAVDYYKNNPKVNVKPWYYAVQNYGNSNDIASNGKNGKSFDDLNAVKLYFKLRDLAKAKIFANGTTYTNEQTIQTAGTRFADALKGIKTADATYVIKSSDLPGAAGGWWHKSSYVNQMWCDGQYMGPALLAQIINGYEGYSKVSASGTDWDLVTKQFQICWNYLWDADKELLWHAFSATPTDSYSNTWADPSAYHSKEYWGRAAGWYFLALVDVLEEMQAANLTATENYKTLRGYLNKVAAGLAKRADAKTGCWYQLLQYDGTFYADSYNGQAKTQTYNYLESSASAIFIAAYLKGMRLGCYDADYTEVAKKAYKGFVENFMVSDGTGGIHIINSCRSAGLGGKNYRDGSAAYYLLGSDVSMVKLSEQQTEGKVLGAFILAATEYERTFFKEATVEPAPIPDPKPDPDPDEDPDSTPAVTDNSGNSFFVGEGDTADNGKQITLKYITMTYGNDGQWKPAELDPEGREGFSWFIVGNTNPNNTSQPTSGTCYVFEPKADGTLSVAVRIYISKKTYVTENGTGITVQLNGKSFAPGQVADANTLTYGNLTFPVKSGNKYYVFGSGTKLAFFGFSFLPTLQGDANGDGMITVQDANMVVNYSLGRNPSGIKLNLSDMNGDSKVDNTDANAIIDSYLK